MAPSSTSSCSAFVANESFDCLAGPSDLAPKNFLIHERGKKISSKLRYFPIHRRSVNNCTRSHRDNQGEEQTHPIVVCADFTYPKVACFGAILSHLNVEKPRAASTGCSNRFVLVPVAAEPENNNSRSPRTLGKATVMCRAMVIARPELARACDLRECWCW